MAYTKAEKKAYDRKRYLLKRVAINAASRRYYLKNIAAVSRYRAGWNLKNKYGITLEEAEAKLEAQGGCAICGRDDIKFMAGKKSDNNANVDHCHDTGKVRGILCTLCNVGMGALGDSPELLDKAKEYLCAYK